MKRSRTRMTVAALVSFLILLGTVVRPANPLPALSNRATAAEAPGNLWYVFRQVHASDLANRPLLNSSLPSSKVVEKTKVIPKEVPKVGSSFTIISRIQRPLSSSWASMNKPPHRLGALNVISITGRKTEAAGAASLNGQHIEPHSPKVFINETSQAANATLVPPIEPLNERPESSGANSPPPTSTPVNDDDEKTRNLGGFYTIKNGRIEFHLSRGGGGGSDKTLVSQRPATSSNDIVWEKPPPPPPPLLPRPQKQSTGKADSTAWLNKRPALPILPGNNLDEPQMLSVEQKKPETLSTASPDASKHTDSSLLAVRVNGSTFYAAQTTFSNGTVIFERSTSTDLEATKKEHPTWRWHDLADVETYYPGFTQMVRLLPARLIIRSSVVTSNLGQDEPQTTVGPIDPPDASVGLRQLPHTVRIDDQTVLVPSNSPWAGNGTLVYKSRNAADVPTANRSGHVSVDHVESFYPGFRAAAESKPTHVLVQNSVQHPNESQPIVTDVPNGPFEEQVPPPVLPAVTHPLTTSSSSSPSSSSSWLLQYSQTDANQPLTDWSMASQVMQRARLQSTSSIPSSTTAAATSTSSTTTTTTTTKKPPPAVANLVLIPLASSSTEQTLTAVGDKPPGRTAPTLKPVIPTSYILQSKPDPVPVFPAPASAPIPAAAGGSGGLASLIMAHTAALISGKPSPFGRHSPLPGKSSHLMAPFVNSIPSSANKSSGVPAVHIIVATALPDPDLLTTTEDTLRFRSLDSVENNKNKTSSWAFPSFSQLMDSADSFLASAFGSARQQSGGPVSSYNRSSVEDPVLPLYPRYDTCGQEISTADSVLTNPSYPEPDSTAGRCTFRLRVTSQDVCQVRVEFKESRMLLPRHGSCKDQQLAVSGSIVPHPSGVENKFCGWNSDQHFYVQLTEPDGQDRTVEFTVDTTVADYLYRYSLVVQQIDCRLPNPSQAPRGCFQYFYTGRSGVIKSFNYDGGQYTNNQSYRICVRAIDQSCTLTLSSRSGDFGLSRATSSRVTSDRTGIGAKACPRDYLWIPGSVTGDDGGVESNTRDRYCGATFSGRNGGSQPEPVVVRMYSSVHMMEFRTGTPRLFDAATRGQGFRINFTQTSECPPLVQEPPNRAEEDLSVQYDYDQQDDFLSEVSSQ